MCAISGLFYRDKKFNIDVEKFKAGVLKMNEAQVRRGPDDQGIFCSAPVVFGNCRLSIIDLTPAGHQPMHYQIQNSKLKIKNFSGWITFNGEIYNFLELRKELDVQNYKFKTKTDTETILALYAEYGEKSFSMLRGMFAFALWDENNKKLFLVKDRYGIKPLYYWIGKDKIVFASTVGALKKSGFLPIVSNTEALIGFLLFGSVPLPMTTLKNVMAIPAGHYLVAGDGHPEKLVKYYDPLAAFERKNLEINFETAVSEVRDLLEESVNLHLISDAPLGVFLSGGLDSSALAALSASLRDKPVSTLSVDFEEEEFSERFYQKLVVEAIKSDHHRIQIGKKDFFSALPAVFEAMDQPTIDGVNTFFIAEVAKKAGLKAVLSGLGSDEIFFGYPSFKKAFLIRQIQNLPSFLKQPINLFSIFGDRYSKLNYFLESDPLSFYLGIRGLFEPKEVSRILDVDLAEIKNFLSEVLTNYFSSIRLPMDKLGPVDLLSYLEIKFYLQNQLLKDTDFMSMHHSIEVRVPFLDHFLVEYASSLKPQVKLNKSGGANKPLLVEAVRDLLPEEILARPKMGFTFPFEKWLQELISHEAPVSENGPMGDYKNKFLSGRLHWSRYWALYVLKERKFI